MLNPPPFFGSETVTSMRLPFWLALHVDDGDVFLVAPALLDDDLDVGLVPGANLDRTVERGQHDLGLAGDRKELLLPLDVSGPAQVGADDVDTTRCDEQHHQSASA